MKLKLKLVPRGTVPPLHFTTSSRRIRHVTLSFFTIQEEDISHLFTSYNQSNNKNKTSVKLSQILSASFYLFVGFVPFCFVPGANKRSQFTDIIISMGENEIQKQNFWNNKRIHSSSTSKNLHSRNNVQRRKRKGEENRNPYVAIHCQLLNMQPNYPERHPKFRGVKSFAFSTKAISDTKQKPPNMSTRLDRSRVLIRRGFGGPALCTSLFDGLCHFQRFSRLFAGAGACVVAEGRGPASAAAWRRRDARSGQECRFLLAGHDHQDLLLVRSLRFLVLFRFSLASFQVPFCFPVPFKVPGELPVGACKDQQSEGYETQHRR